MNKTTQLKNKEEIWRCLLESLPTFPEALVQLVCAYFSETCFPLGFQGILDRQWDIKMPRGLVTDGELIYIPDGDSISVRNQEGEILSHFSTMNGSQERLFTSPHYTTIYNSQIFICDYHNTEVQILSLPSRKFIRAINTQISCKGVAVYNDLVFVTRTTTSFADIAVYDMDGKLIRKWSRNGTGPGELSDPHGIAISGNGAVVYVADGSNRRLCLFSLEGIYQESWGSPGTKILNHPRGVLVDESNDFVFVSDEQSLHQFDAKDGKFLQKWGDLKYGQQFCFLNGMCFIADYLSNKIKILK